jgi:TonB family protein
MKKLFLFCVIFFAVLFTGNFVEAVEKAGISVDSRAEIPAAKLINTQEAFIEYKKDMDATFFNYLHNSKRHFKNRAKVSFTVTNDGHVNNVSLLQSSGNKKNDDMVVEMVKTSVFLTFPREINVKSMMFNYYISNPRWSFDLASPSLSATSVSSPAVSDSFLSTVLVFDSVMMVADFVLKCCLFGKI